MSILVHGYHEVLWTSLSTRLHVLPPLLERGGRTAFEQVFLVSLYPAMRYDLHVHVKSSIE